MLGREREEERREEEAARSSSAHGTDKQAIIRTRKPRPPLYGSVTACKPEFSGGIEREKRNAQSLL